MSSADRREWPRLEGEFPVDLLNMGDDPSISPFETIIPGRALDVSKKGLRLKVAYNVSVGSILSVIMYYKGSESICLCQVVWKRDVVGEKLYGLFIKEWSKIDFLLEKKLNAMTPQSASPAQPQKALL